MWFLFRIKKETDREKKKKENFEVSSFPTDPQFR